MSNKSYQKTAAELREAIANLPERVNTNWIVLQTHQIDAETEYTLCFIPSGCIPKFATHTRRIDTPNNLFWGHYFDNIIEVTSYWKKITKYNQI